MGVNYHHLVVLEINALNSLMACVVHNLAGPTPTTFLAATDALSYFEGEFEGGSKVWLHLPAVHLAMFTFSVLVTDSVQKLIWYCVMFPFGPGHASEGSTGFWREMNQTTHYESIPSYFTND